VYTLLVSSISLLAATAKPMAAIEKRTPPVMQAMMTFQLITIIRTRWRMVAVNGCFAAKFSMMLLLFQTLGGCAMVKNSGGQNHSSRKYIFLTGTCGS
jgi:hypothetical protein